MHVGEVKLRDNVLNRENFASVLRRPAEHAKEVAHGGGQEVARLIFFDKRATIAFGHFARAFRFQNQRNVREFRRLHAESLVKLNVFARVGKMVFAANDVRDFHRDVVNDVHEVENGFAVPAHDDEVAVFGAFDAPADNIVDNNRRGVNAFVFFFQKIVINGFAFTFEADSFMSRYPDELLPSCEKLLHDTGRYLINLIETKKK